MRLQAMRVFGLKRELMFLLLEMGLGFSSNSKQRNNNGKIKPW